MLFFRIIVKKCAWGLYNSDTPFQYFISFVICKMKTACSLANCLKLPRGFVCLRINHAFIGNSVRHSLMSSSSPLRRWTQIYKLYYVKHKNLCKRLSDPHGF